MDKNLTQDIAENFVDLLIGKYRIEINSQQSRNIEKELVKLLEEYGLMVYGQHF